jgi:hypothetical protein
MRTNKSLQYYRKQNPKEKQISRHTFFYSLRSVYEQLGFDDCLYSQSNNSFYILSTYGGIFLQRMEAAIACTAFNLQRRRLTISINIFA